jgi:hypothetical protein
LLVDASKTKPKALTPLRSDALHSKPEGDFASRENAGNRQDFYLLFTIPTKNHKTARRNCPVFSRGA